jgi:DNA-binding FadR family transcriptional regulator
MAERLGIGRSALRRGPDRLKQESLVCRHVGKGTFVAAGRPDDAPGLGDLSRSVSPLHMMRARLAVEPAIAREAAINASAAGVERIRATHERAVAARSWDAYEAEDDRLHRAIAQATDNMLLLALFDQLNAVRRAVSWNTVIRRSDRPAPDHTSFAQHDRIVSAIEVRRALEAQDAMRAHLHSVSLRLFGEHEDVPRIA